MHAHQLLVPLFIISCLPVMAAAQSMAVIGGGTEARACYRAASFAAQAKLAGQDDLQACTRALDHESLDLRDRAATFLNRGVVKVALEDYKGAVKDYKRAQKLNPNAGEIYINRGNLWYMTGHFEKAISHYDKAMALDVRQRHVAFLNRGLAYEKNGDLAEAEQDYRSAIELSPDWTYANERLQGLLSKP